MHGAVPTSLFNTSQHFGTRAWARLTGVSSKPRTAKRRFTFSSATSLSTSSEPKYSHSSFFVISSFVGPSPPVTSTVSDECMAASTACQMSSRLSPTTTVFPTSIPASVSIRAIVEAFVLTTCPISSSSPILIIVTFIILTETNASSSCRTPRRRSPGRSLRRTSARPVSPA